MWKTNVIMKATEHDTIAWCDVYFLEWRHTIQLHSFTLTDEVYQQNYCEKRFFSKFVCVASFFSQVIINNQQQTCFTIVFFSSKVITRWNGCSSDLTCHLANNNSTAAPHDYYSGSWLIPFNGWSLLVWRLSSILWNSCIVSAHFLLSAGHCTGNCAKNNTIQNARGKKE